MAAKPYFTLKKAQNVIRLNFALLSDTKLMKTIVILRDFQRYTNDATNYGDILLKGNYFVGACSQSSTGVAPKDIWLARNLTFCLNEALKERRTRNGLH